MRTRGVSQALRGITSATYRRKVREVYKRWGGQTRPFHRELLAAAVSEVMDDLEHRSPQHEQVRWLRATMNLLLDDLRQNEPHPGVLVGGERRPARYPDCEAVAELLARKRKVAPMSPERRAALTEQLRRGRGRD